MLVAFLVVILVILGVAAIFTAQAVLTLVRVGVPSVATDRWAIRWLSEHLDLNPGQTFVDLGCGDGRVLVALARRFPQATLVGYELGWWPYLRARLNTYRWKNISIDRRDFMADRYSEADVVFCYLFTHWMPRLEGKLQAELKPGSRVYSFGFRFPNWRPSEVVRRPDKGSGSQLWVYQVR